MIMSRDRHTSPPLPNLRDVTRCVDWSIRTRRSVRAFLDRHVPREEVEAILDTARYSPSGMNIQPWHVHVVSGETKTRLSSAMAAVDADPMRSADLDEPFQYYPREWVPPYVDRRRKVGWDLYGLLDIRKGDKARMQRQHGRNYEFFDAPVGLFFTMDRGMQEGSLIDCGMFLQSVMIAARSRGLHTCAQAAFLKFHRIIFSELGIAESQMLVCGMSLGYADDKRIENTLATEREPVAAFTTFHHHSSETTV
jgi:nitroreductase